MNKVFLEDSDFENKRLNKSFFTNINKGISEAEFLASYPTAKFDNFEKGIVEEWIKGTYETTGGEIVKGSFNDTSEVSQALENMKSQVSLLKGIIVESNDGKLREVFVMPKQEVKETLQKAKGEDDLLEKGAIRDTLFYSELNMKFNKTGKEIKEKIAIIKTKEDAKIATLEVEMNVLQDTLIYQPTEFYSSDDDNYGIKTFKWDMTYKSDSPMGNNVVQFNEAESGTLNQAECDLHRKWNDLVYNYRNCKQEIDAINLLEDNIEDTKKYELSARQMLTFGF